jgi:hypothetical protein
MLVQCSITLHLIKIFLGFQDPHGWWHAGFISSTSEAATVDDAQSFRQTPSSQATLVARKNRGRQAKRDDVGNACGTLTSGETSRPSTGRKVKAQVDGLIIGSI